MLFLALFSSPLLCGRGKRGKAIPEDSLSTRKALLRPRSTAAFSPLLPPPLLLHFSLIRLLDQHQPPISSHHSVITGWSPGKTLLSSAMSFSRRLIDGARNLLGAHRLFSAAIGLSNYLCAIISFLPGRSWQAFRPFRSIPPRTREWHDDRFRSPIIGENEEPRKSLRVALSFVVPPQGRRIIRGRRHHDRV